MNAIYIKHSDDELYHHGVKGQRWGVRRYQNPDGTLTALGKTKQGREKLAVKAAKDYYRSENTRRRANNEYNSVLSKAYFKFERNALKKHSKKFKESEQVKTRNLTKKEIDRGRAIVAEKNLLRSRIGLGISGYAAAGSVALASMGNVMTAPLIVTNISNARDRYDDIKYYKKEVQKYK